MAASQTTPAPPESLPNPWWIPPFLGKIPPGVERKHLSLLGAVAAALIFEEYDLALITSVLPFIATYFGVPESSLPTYLGVVRVGAILAFPLVVYGDRIGRRRTFLASLAASAAATVATGFAWSMESFVFFQMLVRVTFVAGVSVAYVLVAEEFPAERRGWGMGVLAAVGATGYAIEALLFSQMHHLPYEWRALYWVGVIPLLLLGVFARRIPETERFEAQDASGAVAESWFEPMRRLLAESSGRLATVAAGMAIQGFAGVAAFQFTAYHTIKYLGWTKGEYAAMFIIGGAIGIVGNVVAGHLGDRFGRRWVGGVCYALFPAWVALFYWGPANVVPFAWVGFVFTSSGGRMILRAFSTELFPTAHRATAGGWLLLVEVLSSALGLFALAPFVANEGDLAQSIPYLACATLLVSGILLFLPETRSRELEEI